MLKVHREEKEGILSKLGKLVTKRKIDNENRTVANRVSARRKHKKAKMGLGDVHGGSHNPMRRGE